MPFILGQGKAAGVVDSDAFPRYFDFLDFASTWADKINEGFQPQDFVGQDAKLCRQKLARLIIVSIKKLFENKHALVRRTSGKLTEDETEFLYRHLFLCLENNHPVIWPHIGVFVVDISNYSKAFYTRMENDGYKLRDEFTVCYEPRDPVVPTFARCYSLPPAIENDPYIAVDLRAFIGTDEEDNVSLFFDSMQSSHMHDINLLIWMGQSFDNMRQKGKDDDSRYSHTTLQDFVNANVVRDLVDGFKLKKANVPLDGNRYDYGIQAQVVGSTRIEMSARYVCEHYYAYLHCYPG